MLTYKLFEYAVPLTDLAECPAPMALDHQFCRLTVHNPKLHVFAFAYHDDQTFVGYQKFAAEDLNTPLR